MAETYIYSYPAPIIWQEDSELPNYNPRPSGFVFSKTGSDGRTYYISPTPQTFANQVDVGHWDSSGVLTMVDVDAFDVIRKFGNDTEMATDSLDYHGYTGHQQRNMQVLPGVLDTDLHYDDAEQPYEITATRFNDGAGWGLRFTMIGDIAGRDVAQRKVTVFPNDTYSGSRYVCANFAAKNLGTVEEPIDGYQTETPPGQLDVNSTDAWFSISLGAAEEGRWSQLAGTDTSSRFYWQYNQGEKVVVSGNAIESYAGSGTLSTNGTSQDALTSIAADFDGFPAMAVLDNGLRPMVKTLVPTEAGKTYRIISLIHNNNIVGNGKIGVYDGDQLAVTISGDGDILEYIPPKLAAWQSVDQIFIACSSETTIAFKVRNNKISYMSFFKVDEV